MDAWAMIAGSSPRMRGARLCLVYVRLRVGIIPAYAGSTGNRGHHDHGGGIIPAYAGSTASRPTTRRRVRDHPRVCGERIPSSVSSSTASGSSPRMRGAPKDEASDKVSGRIIPAYAGSTSARPRRCCRRRDHPRVCGEHARPRRWRPQATGSSPRMRGARQWRRAVGEDRGIIPAYAGSTEP